MRFFCNEGIISETLLGIDAGNFPDFTRAARIKDLLEGPNISTNQRRQHPATPHKSGSKTSAAKRSKTQKTHIALDASLPRPDAWAE